MKSFPLLLFLLTLATAHTVPRVHHLCLVAHGVTQQEIIDSISHHLEVGFLSVSLITPENVTLIKEHFENIGMLMDTQPNRAVCVRTARGRDDVLGVTYIRTREYITDKPPVLDCRGVFIRPLGGRMRRYWFHESSPRVPCARIMYNSSEKRMPVNYHRFKLHESEIR
jgi:hypothetical protein